MASFLTSLALLAGLAVSDVTRRPPPLADGSTLTRVHGVLLSGQGGEGWRFRLNDAFEGEEDRELELLPASALEDMIQRHDSMPPGGEARFELSGAVTLYRGRNAVLPWIAIPVTEFPPRRPRQPLRPPGSVAASVVPQPEESPQPPPTAGQEPPAFASAWMPLLPEARDRAASTPLAVKGDVQSDEIERRLLDRVGEVHRSPDFGTARTEPAASASEDPVRDRPWLDSDRSIQDRLGVVSRDPVTGAWRFVFESSRGDVGEREAVLLPCASLERLERIARSQAAPLTVVLSGTVSRFMGRAYLLPTAFHPLRSGKALGR